METGGTHRLQPVPWRRWLSFRRSELLGGNQHIVFDFERGAHNPNPNM
jgi:hypothetical protein